MGAVHNSEDIENIKLVSFLSSEVLIFPQEGWI